MSITPNNTHHQWVQMGADNLVSAREHSQATATADCGMLLATDLSQLLINGRSNNQYQPSSLTICSVECWLILFHKSSLDSTAA